MICFYFLCFTHFYVFYCYSICFVFFIIPCCILGLFTNIIMCFSICTFRFLFFMFNNLAICFHFLRFTHFYVFCCYSICFAFLLFLLTFWNSLQTLLRVFNFCFLLIGIVLYKSYKQYNNMFSFYFKFLSFTYNNLVICFYILNFTHFYVLCCCSICFVFFIIPFYILEFFTTIFCVSC